jgi:hypothetical protein
VGETPVLSNPPVNDDRGELVRFLTTLGRPSVGVALGACLLAAAPTVAASPAQAGPAVPDVSPSAAASWSVRVLPSTSALSEPSFLLDDGIVVGTDATTEIYGQGRPWTWSLPTGRRNLSLGGGDWGLVTAAPSPLGIVGTTYTSNPTTGYDSTAMRWTGGRPAPLLPDSTQNSNAQTANRAGDAVVAEGPELSGTTSLVVRGQAPVLLPLFSGRQVGRSMNAAHQIVIASYGPGTIGPVSYEVLQDGQPADLNITETHDFPPCVGDITESGYVAGSKLTVQSGVPRRQASLWRAGVRTVLPDDGLSAEVPCSRHPVNEAGAVVGTLSALPVPGQPTPPPSRTVVWRDGQYTVLATDSAQETVRPIAINDRGAVLALVTPTGGSARPAVYSGGARRLLPVPPGVTNVAALDLNERNQVVGSGTRTVGGTARTVTLFWTPTTS